MNIFRRIMLLVSTIAGVGAMVKPEWAGYLAPIAAIAANFNGGSKKDDNAAK